MALGLFKVQSAKTDCQGNKLTHLELVKRLDEKEALAILTKRRADSADEYMIGEL